MRYTVRPISDRTAFTGDPTRSPFRANWSQTLRLLGDELAQLAATDVVLELDVTAGDVRLDGMVRANAKVATPGVRIAFDSVHGPLTYATDAFYSPWAGEPDWQHNVRAIALSLESHRYGVTKRGEQYAGWKALPSGRAMPPSHMTAEQADAVFTRVLGGRWTNRLTNRPLRDARAATHPDRHAGEQAAYDEVEQAAAVLGVTR